MCPTRQQIGKKQSCRLWWYISANACERNWQVCDRESNRTLSWFCFTQSAIPCATAAFAVLRLRKSVSCRLSNDFSQDSLSEGSQSLEYTEILPFTRAAFWLYVVVIRDAPFGKVLEGIGIGLHECI